MAGGIHFSSFELRPRPIPFGDAVLRSNKQLRIDFFELELNCQESLTKKSNRFAFSMSHSEAGAGMAAARARTKIEKQAGCEVRFGLHLLVLAPSF